MKKGADENIKDATGRTSQDIADHLKQTVKIKSVISKQTSNQKGSKNSSTNSKKIENFTEDSKFEMLNDLFNLGILSKEEYDDLLKFTFNSK
jgi:hypothetical protein